jgi:hypothetical protein
MTKTFTKVINPATVGDNESQNYGVYIKIEYKQKESDPKKLCLSMSGVIGPRANGDCAGSCGQMIDDVLDYNFINWKNGYDLATYKKFIAIWQTWHLNDFKAGCEHQRAEHWGDKKVILYTHKMTSETLSAQNSLNKKIEEQLKNIGSFTLKGKEKALYSLSYSITTNSETPPDGYKLDRAEEKGTGWLTQEEHPDGVLCKPCPVCGYKYGTAWRFEEVPAEVIDWLKSLPATKITPAWV